MPPAPLTQTEEVYLTQKEFNKIIKSKDFRKIFNKFEKHPTSYNYNLLTTYLGKKISFTALTNPAFSFYLSNNRGKIIVSNIDNNFSTFTNYTDNIDFKNISEKSEFLNNLNTVQKKNETNINLLREPDLNILLSSQATSNNYDYFNSLYYTVQRRQCHEGYILTGFLYDTFIPPPNPV
jgi:hypothetical protein